MTTVGSLLGKPFANGVSKAVGTLNKKVLSARPSQVVSTIAHLRNAREGYAMQFCSELSRQGLAKGDKWTKAGKNKLFSLFKDVGFNKNTTIKDFYDCLKRRALG